MTERSVTRPLNGISSAPSRAVEELKPRPGSTRSVAVHRPAPHPLQGLPRVSLTEAETAERAEGSRVNQHIGRGDSPAIGNAVSVPKNEPSSPRSRHHQRSVMNRSMVNATQRDQVLRTMLAAIGMRFEVMNVDEGRVPAAWHPAAMLVSPQHAAPNGGRDPLRSAGGVCT